LPEPTFSPQQTRDFEEVPFAPPPARVEIIPPRPPNAGTVWIDGEWEWNGTKWGWQYGHWVVAPPSASYSKWATVRRRSDGVLFFAPGVWRSRNGAELPPPPPLAVARARDESIVNPEGKTERTAPNVNPEGTPSGLK